MVGRNSTRRPAEINGRRSGGCPVWNGIRLKDILEDCGIKENAVYMAYHSADQHLSGDPSKDAISEAFPSPKHWRKSDDRLGHE